MTFLKNKNKFSEPIKKKGGENMNALGRHLLLELKGADGRILNDLHFIKDVMLKAAEEAGATMIDYSFKKFHPQGVSGVVVIAESHLSIHTWPEYGYAAVDIFTCGENLKPDHAAQILIKELRSKEPALMEIKRGIISWKGEKLPHKPEGECIESSKAFRAVF